MFKKKLVVCGDSFSAGIGCVNMLTQAYGVLVAEHLGLELITLARGSASNYAIYLQAMQAGDFDEVPELVIIGQTSYDRIEWVAEGVDANWHHTLHNLNYHLYPPHHLAQPHHAGPLPFFLKDDPNYNPYILSEQVGAIDDYINCVKKNQNVGYYKRLHSEPIEKLKLIRDYYIKIFDGGVKRDYDNGLLVQSYNYLKKRGAKVIILSCEEKIKKFIDEDDLVWQDWGRMVAQYPDTIGSMHTSHLGHEDTAFRIIDKLSKQKK